MKPRRILETSLALIIFTLPAHADLFWDGTTSTADADGGNGTWDTTTQNWDTLATGGANTAWSNTETAIFGATAGTVSVAAGGITAANVTFNTTGYTVQNNTLTVGAGSITTAPGVTATISSNITGTNGLTKAGAGTLNTTGGNSYTGNTTVTAGTLKIGLAQPAFRYYRFTVTANNGDGYNQIGELHFYKSGTWMPASAGVAAPTNGALGSEQFWGNANDNKGANVAGFTKFGVGGFPYSLTYDFTSPITLDAYNWSSANDSTPGRNPRLWTVSGSNDNVNFTVIDNRSVVSQAGPGTTYNWSASNGTYVTVDNSANGGAANAYPLLPISSLPGSSPLMIAVGSTLDLNGINQTSPSLADSGGGGGTVTNSAATTPVFFTIGSAASTNFSGTIGDAGVGGAVSLSKISTGVQTLSGTASNTFSGVTTLGGTGKLVLAKTGGAIAIPGNVNLSSTAFNGNNSGIVLGGDEQIADAALLT